MEEIIKRIKDYTFFVIDEKGIIGKATGKFISLNNKNFFEIVTDKKLAGRVFIKIKKENEAEEILNIKLENEIVTFKINFWKENGKIFCLAKELQLEKPSLITDFLGNVLYGNEKWKSIVGQNIFELVENRNALFEAIEKAIEHGEHEKEIFINDRKAKVKIKVNEYLEFYIQEDIFPIIKEIVDSKSKKELLENLKKALDLLHVDYAIKLFDMEFGYRENGIYKFPIYGKGSIVGSILIYDEIDELTKNKIQCISIASSLAVENFEK